MVTLQEKARLAFRDHFGSDPKYFAIAPGRVNMLGEHVDYNDGYVLPVAIDLSTFIAFSPSTDGVNKIVALDFSEQTQFDQISIIEKNDIDQKPLYEWALYPAGIFWVINEQGLEVKGMNAVFCSSVPRGAGLSSSASVEMAFMIAWQSLSKWELGPMERAKLGKKAENEYVGVQCGIMDQFSSACGVADHMLFLDCRSLVWKTVGLPKDYSIIIIDTNLPRKLIDSEYNNRRRACDQAVEILTKSIPNIHSLRDVSLEDFENFHFLLPYPINKRARHVIEEIDRTLKAISFLESHDFKAFGFLMNQSHTSLRDLYDVSTPQLDILVEIAQNFSGCLGSRLTGAGFGGCTVSLVERKRTKEFSSYVTKLYTSKTGLEANIYITSASEGARLISNI